MPISGIAGRRLLGIADLDLEKVKVCLVRIAELSTEEMLRQRTNVRFGEAAMQRNQAVRRLG